MRPDCLFRCSSCSLIISCVEYVYIIYNSVIIRIKFLKIHQSLFCSNLTCIYNHLSCIGFVCRCFVFSIKTHLFRKQNRTYNNEFRRKLTAGIVFKIIGGTAGSSILAITGSIQHIRKTFLRRRYRITYILKFCQYNQSLMISIRMNTVHHRIIPSTNIHHSFLTGSCSHIHSHPFRTYSQHSCFLSGTV